jgi:hypothetical protein
MGILDDAIREHLELKRQRGATESELKQLEDEAFGPPSRPGEPDFPESEGPGEPSGNGVATQAVTDGPGAPEEPSEPMASEGALEEQPVAEHPVVEAPAEPAEEPEPSEEGTAPDEAPIESLETAEQPFPDEAEETELQPIEEPGAAPDVVSEPDTAEGEAPDEGGVPSEEESDDDDDVLADTPDFLKDAPEDDELWFEQGEPKDFDF